MSFALQRDGLLAGIAVASLGSVGLALLAQYGFGMQPCAWCALQRLVFVSIALAALLGLAWRSRFGLRLSAALVLGLAASGAAAAVWQNRVAAKSESCNLTLAERILSGLGLDGTLPLVFQPRASCADAAASLFGVPFEFWSLALFLALGAVASWLLWRAPRLSAARR